MSRTTEPPIMKPHDAAELEQARYCAGDWLTTAECGPIAGGAKDSTVRQWIRDRKLPALNISPGRKVPEYRVRRADLDAFIAENMSNA